MSRARLEVVQLIRRVLSPITARSTWSRAAYLVLGGTVLVPYVVVAAYVGGNVPDLRGTTLVLALLALTVLGLAAVLATGMLPAVRRVEVTTARELLGGPISEQVMTEPRTRSGRLRAAAFFTAHLLSGGLIGVLTLTVVPLGIVWLLDPLVELEVMRESLPGQPLWMLPVAGLALLAGYVYTIAGTGELLSRGAMWLLGPCPADELARLEELTDDLAERNRIARDLHDSVGHALSVVTLQAGAARRLWDKDPEFAHQALGAVEQSARLALADLDHVLGLLRDDGGASTLDQLDTLVRRHRATGARLDVRHGGSVSGLPVSVSREAYLIVQEALANVLRHSPDCPARLDVEVDEDGLAVQVANPTPPTPPESRATGGRGLRGIRERVEALGGTLEVGQHDDEWLVDVRIPTEGQR